MTRLAMKTKYCHDTKTEKKTKIENSKPISIINIKENITNEILKSLMPEMQGWINTWKCIDKTYRINTWKKKKM